MLNHNIVIIIYQGVTLLDVTGPAQVFFSANKESDSSENGYQIVVASTDGGMICTDTGLEIATISIAELANTFIDTIIVAGGNGVFNACEDLVMVNWLKANVPKARRSVSTCMGAFLMAETGLLNNKKVTTHWRWCNELSQRYPNINVIAEPIYIKQGNFSSSAGVTAGIDLSLSLVADDYGRSLALAVAKNLVLYLKRSGLQTQFSSMLELQGSEYSNRFDGLHDWISKNLDKTLNVETLAEKVGMSRRNFSRTYSKLVGKTPAKAVEIIRFEHAKSLLETTNLSLKSISKTCGFKDYERMRRTFVRQIGISPLEYHHRFGEEHYLDP